MPISLLPDPVIPITGDDATSTADSYRAPIVDDSAPTEHQADCVADSSKDTARGLWWKRRIEDAGFTKRRLAHETKLGEKTIYNLEQGGNVLPSTLAAVRVTLGMSPDEGPPAHLGDDGAGDLHHDEERFMQTMSRLSVDNKAVVATYGAWLHRQPPASQVEERAHLLGRILPDDLAQ